MSVVHYSKIWELTRLMPKKPLHMEIHLLSAKGNFFTDISVVLRAMQPSGQTSQSLQRVLLGIKNSFGH